MYDKTAVTLKQRCYHVDDDTPELALVCGGTPATFQPSLIIHYYQGIFSNKYSIGMSVISE